MSTSEEADGNPTPPWAETRPATDFGLLGEEGSPARPVWALLSRSKEGRDEVGAANARDFRGSFSDDPNATWSSSKVLWSFHDASMPMLLPPMLKRLRDDPEDGSPPVLVSKYSARHESSSGQSARASPKNVILWEEGNDDMPVLGSEGSSSFFENAAGKVPDPALFEHGDDDDSDEVPPSSAERAAVVWEVPVLQWPVRRAPKLPTAARLLRTTLLPKLAPEKFTSPPCSANVSADPTDPPEGTFAAAPAPSSLTTAPPWARVADAAGLGKATAAFVAAALEAAARLRFRFLMAAADAMER
mmetsp:Transcript_4061/g.8698  ORF Transcript_4061/g.8698 Transcript_4061/m.8698 type:complete len:302 (-) Transcript_4061:587-1492(-)